MRHHRDTRRFRTRIRVGERASEIGSRAQHREERGRDAERGQLFGILLAGEIGVPPFDGRELSERVRRALLPLEEIAARDRLAVEELVVSAADAMRTVRSTPANRNGLRTIASLNAKIVAFAASPSARVATIVPSEPHLVVGVPCLGIERRTDGG